MPEKKIKILQLTFPTLAITKCLIKKIKLQMTRKLFKYLENSSLMIKNKWKSPFKSINKAQTSHQKAKSHLIKKKITRELRRKTSRSRSKLWKRKKMELRVVMMKSKRVQRINLKSLRRKFLILDLKNKIPKRKCNTKNSRRRKDITIVPKMMMIKKT